MVSLAGLIVLFVFAIILVSFLTNASVASVPAAMQLRDLQTLSEIGGEHNSTVVFPCRSTS